MSDPMKQQAEKVSSIIAKLQVEADRRVARRTLVEARWIEDLRQYHGQYSGDLAERLKRSESSKVFLNLTRPKTNTMIARLYDLLFPTDDRNWGIQPTPVPELSSKAAETASIAEDAETALTERMNDMESEQDPARAEELASEIEEAREIRDKAQEAADSLAEIIRVAKRRCDMMQEEIDDQLVTCKYQAEARDAIEDACKLGTGILKGPVVDGAVKERWVGGNGEYALEIIEDMSPSVVRVDPWSFFPDPDQRRARDSEGFFERHLMNHKQLRQLAKRPDIDSDALRDVIRMGPQLGGLPQHMVDLQSITGENANSAKDVFQVWEYTGPIEHEDLIALAQCACGKKVMDAIAEEEIDPLIEVQAKVWFCQNRVLSLALHPLDSGECIYSVFNLDHDEYGPWGYGVPYLMRDDQSILNAAQRMMMDNAGLSVGPQIVINQNIVTPSDGDWTMHPRKVWLRNAGDADPNQRAFETYDIPMHQQEIANIIVMAKQSIDEVTSMPQIAQGEQGVGVTKTAQGMALLMNSANVLYRRVIKNFDDDVTAPLIRRFYHWNMQFSPKEEIKGDYEVDARGSSVLLVREMLAQNLIMIAQMFGDHPEYGSRIRKEDLLKHIFRAHSIPIADVLYSDREYEKRKKEQEAKAQADPAAQAEMAKVEVAKAEVDLRQQEMQAKQQMHQMEWDARLKIAQMARDDDMEKAAHGLGLRQQEIDSRASDKAEAARIKAETERRKIDSAERKLAVEVAEARRTGVSAGGSV